MENKQYGLVATAFLPHGTMTLDPMRPDIPLGAPSLHHASLETAQRLAALHPDLIILSTPHGLSLSSCLGIYLSPSASGNAEWNSEWNNFSVNLSLHTAAAKDLLMYLCKSSTVPIAEGITCYGGFAAPLRWGEVVPAFFLETAFQKSGTQRSPKYVILTQPSGLGITPQQTLDHRQSLWPLLRKAGNTVYHWIQEYAHTHQLRIAVVVSGDLAHTHAYKRETTPLLYQPDPMATFLPVECADEFDRGMCEWVTKGGGWEKLILGPGKSEREARVCGWTGCLWLQGILEEAKWGDHCGQLLACEHPTYFGMMCAIWIPNTLK